MVIVLFVPSKLTWSSVILSTLLTYSVIFASPPPHNYSKQQVLSKEGNEQIIADRINELTVSATGYLLYLGITFGNLGCNLDDAERHEWDLSFLTRHQRKQIIRGAVVWTKAQAAVIRIPIDDSPRSPFNLLVDYYLENSSYNQCLYWAHKGSEVGSAYCASILKQMYADGLGIVQSYEEAAKWAYISAALGNEQMQELVHHLQDETLHSDHSFWSAIQKGKLKAQEWTNEHLDLFAYDEYPSCNSS